MSRRTGNLVFEIPGGDPVLNERLRRIAEQIELGNRTISTTATVAASPVAGVDISVAGALKIVDGVISVKGQGITTELIKTFAVSASKLAAAAVETDKIKAGAVTTTKIQNAAITNALIGNLAVSAANIQDAAITTAKIQNAAITNALIANAAITDAKIGDAQISSAKIVSLAAGKISTGTMSAVNMIGGTLALNLNGAQTNIDNALTYNGVEVSPGFRMSDNATGRRSVITPLGVSVSNANGSQIGAYMTYSTFSNAGVVGVYGAGGGLATVQMSGAAGGQLIVGLNKVVGPRGAAVADATDAASVITQLNALLARCRAHGLIS